MSRNLTLLDNNQIVTRQYDPEHEAIRAVIVGGADIKMNATIDTSKLEEKLDNFKLETPNFEVKVVEIKAEKEIIKEVEVVKVEVPVVVEKEKIVYVEKPVVSIEKEIVYVDKPVMVNQVEKVEVPVIIKELSVPRYFWYLLAIQTLLLVISIVK